MPEASVHKCGPIEHVEADFLEQWVGWKGDVALLFTGSHERGQDGDIVSSHMVVTDVSDGKPLLCCDFKWDASKRPRGVAAAERKMGQIRAFRAKFSN